jgi:hypothetical protein
VKVLTVTVCPVAIDVLSRVISAGIAPCIWQTAEPSYILKLAAVPVAAAATDQTLALAIDPADGAANGEAGRAIVHRRPAGSAAAQFAGSAPVNIFNVPEAPIAVAFADS